MDSHGRGGAAAHRQGRLRADRLPSPARGRLPTSSASPAAAAGNRISATMRTICHRHRNLPWARPALESLSISRYEDTPGGGPSGRPSSTSSHKTSAPIHPTLSDRSSGSRSTAMVSACASPRRRHATCWRRRSSAAARRWHGLLLGTGAVTYWAGGLLIFTAVRVRRSSRSLRSPVPHSMRSASPYSAAPGPRIRYERRQLDTRGGDHRCGFGEAGGPQPCDGAASTSTRPPFRRHLRPRHQLDRLVREHCCPSTTR